VSKWGVFQWDEFTRHVAPCDDDGGPTHPHIIDTSCFCKPQVWFRDATQGDGEKPWLWVHNDRERGGYNA
jgi:hypothetical protein